MAGRELTRQAKIIFRAALAEVKPEALIRKSVQKRGEMLFIRDRCFDLGSYGNIYLAAIGKAAPWMAGSLAGILGRRLSKGIVVCPAGQSLTVPGIRCLPGAHPLPDGRSLKAAHAILDLAGGAGPKDLLFILISGGGSSQVCLPLQPVTLEEKRRVTGELLRAGADIAELNTVRKHLSAIKGGRLAEAAYPATVVTLIISDVIGNDIGTIASGPTAWDSSTYKDAVQVLQKYRLWSKVPASVRKVLTEGLEGKRPETLKIGDRVFRRVSNFVIGDVLAALQGAARKAEELGFQAVICTSTDSGEAREAAGKYMTFLANLANTKRAFRRPLCLLAGGELTVTVKGKGKGGRNTEFALAALLELMKKPLLLSSAEKGQPRLRYLVSSLGTDGRDGPTDAAGAWVTAHTLSKTRALGLDPVRYLEENDSYSFFKRAGGLVITGPTRTNVMDLRLFLLKRDPKIESAR